MNLQFDNSLKSHFLNLYSIALSDTEIDSKELALLYKLGIERGVTKEDIETIILNPEKVKFSIPDDVLIKIEYLYDFARMICADNKIENDEKVALEKFCLKFGFEHANVSTIAEFLIFEANKGSNLQIVIEQVKQTL